MSKERIDIASYFESGQYTDYESFKKELQTGNESKMFVPASDGFEVYDPQPYEVGTIDWFEQMKEEGYGKPFTVEEIEEYRGFDVTVESDKTSNYDSAAPLSNHVHFDKLTVEETGEVFGVFKANISEDVRGAYTDSFILRFEDEHEFTEALFIQMEIGSFEFETNDYEDFPETYKGTLRANVLTNEIEAQLEWGDYATFEAYMEEIIDDPQELKEVLENEAIEVESITIENEEGNYNIREQKENNWIVDQNEPEL